MRLLGDEVHHPNAKCADEELKYFLPRRAVGRYPVTLEGFEKFLIAAQLRPRQEHAGCLLEDACPACTIAVEGGRRQPEGLRQSDAER